MLRDSSEPRERPLVGSCTDTQRTITLKRVSDSAPSSTCAGTALSSSTSVLVDECWSKEHPLEARLGASHSLLERLGGIRPASSRRSFALALSRFFLVVAVFVPSRREVVNRRKPVAYAELRDLAHSGRKPPYGRFDARAKPVGLRLLNTPVLKLYDRRGGKSRDQVVTVRSKRLLLTDQLQDHVANRSGQPRIRIVNRGRLLEQFYQGIMCNVFRVDDYKVIAAQNVNSAPARPYADSRSVASFRFAFGVQKPCVKLSSCSNAFSRSVGELLRSLRMDQHGEEEQRRLGRHSIWWRRGRRAELPADHARMELHGASLSPKEGNPRWYVEVSGRAVGEVIATSRCRSGQSGAPGRTPGSD